MNSNMPSDMLKLAPSNGYRRTVHKSKDVVSCARHSISCQRPTAGCCHLANLMVWSQSPS